MASHVGGLAVMKCEASVTPQGSYRVELFSLYFSAPPSIPYSSDTFARVFRSFCTFYRQNRSNFYRTPLNNCETRRISWCAILSTSYFCSFAQIVFCRCFKLAQNRQTVSQLHIMNKSHEFHELRTTLEKMIKSRAFFHQHATLDVSGAEDMKVPQWNWRCSVL